MSDDRQRVRTAAAAFVLVGALAAAVAIAAAIGRVAIPLGDQARIVANALRGEPLGGDARLGSILLDVRLPRVALAAITGAGLALSGAALQGLFRNPLADPYLVGVSSGASVGAVIALEAGLPVGLYAAGAVQGAAFSGGLLAVAVTLALARAGGQTSVASMLLAGVAVAAIGGAITSFVLFSSGERIFAAYAWLLGGFNTADWTLVRLVAIPTLLGGGLLVLLGPALDLLQLDEEAARGMGLRVELTKLATIVAATLVAAAAVSASGLIAFVGLIAPHVVRLIAGPTHRKLVGLAALGGAAFLVLADLLARTALPDGDLPVGVVTAAVGGPFFLALLRLRRDRVG
jgi:iron complex transport system permease protein